MQISVRFFTRLREIVGKKEESLSFPDGSHVTVNTVLDVLVQRYGEYFREYVYDKTTGTVREFLQFLINGQNIASASRLQAELKDGDVLAILPPVGGG
ncbi:MAG: ubiquitin-like small modifier protein 1 [Candidatus Bathyarchaeia archaeon]